LINFVSNLPKDLRSGGFSAMNVAAFSALSESEAVNYVGPINPPVIARQKAWSKLGRVIGMRGSFFFFSEERLNAIAHEVHSKCQAEARLDFFHGFTPWIATRPERPYLAWSDCTFHDYVDIYHRRDEFITGDLKRIENAEATWLRRADRVLFTSNWAVERAVRHYSLDARRVASVGIFGETEMPERDVYAGRQEFAFVSTNFEAKGGRIVLAAFRVVRNRYPDASLVIVGDRPPRHMLGPGVRVAGFLRKEVPHEYQQFREILAGARAIVSATSSDICPLLFVEAGYSGCPVISTRKFAIPEIVDDGRTGLLLDDLPNPDSLARAMSRLLEMTDDYQQMRAAAWAKARSIHSREKFEERLCSLQETGNGAGLRTTSLKLQDC
jgi:glycosyltransferase involved in cell wall biosynthesis